MGLRGRIPNQKGDYKGYVGKPWLKRGIKSTAQGGTMLAGKLGFHQSSCPPRYFFFGPLGQLRCDALGRLDPLADTRSTSKHGTNGGGRSGHERPIDMYT